MGSVYLATDTTINRKMAIKFISPELWQRRAAYLRFLREANVCLDLTHNHIIRVYNLEEWQGQTFLTMEFLDGFSLRTLMYHLKKQNAPTDWARCRGILRQVLEAMEYAHGRGVVHRDLKPGNIMLAKEPGGSHRAVVMDFGLARKDEDGMEAKTRIGSSLGTPEYMAPEQAVSAAQVDGRADLFSVGAIAYEMLTGRVPRGKLEAPSQLCPTLPDGVDEWVFKALEHDREKRFQSAHEMLVELRNIGRKTQHASSLGMELAPLDSKVDSKMDSRSDSKLQENKSADSSSVLEMGSGLDDLASADEFLQSAGQELFATSSPSSSSTYKRPMSFQLPPGLLKIVGIVIAVAAVGWGGVSLLGKLTKPDVKPLVTDTTTPNTSLVTQVSTTVATPVPAIKDNFTETSADVGLEMIWLTGGQFVMGNSANPDDLARQYGISAVSLADEVPAGNVELGGFWISKTEVTLAQYKKFVDLVPDESVKKSGPWSISTAAVSDDMPVTYVNWQHAYAFCMWLSNQTGKTYRLPTEAQWEYACRAGTTTQFHHGDLFSGLGDFAWMSENSAATIHPVALKKPNAFGLFDMHGNVWEWCRDYYNDTYYRSRDPREPMNATESPFRVVRGGAFNMDPQECRSSIRSRQTPDTATESIGFRVVCLTEIPAHEIAARAKAEAAAKAKAAAQLKAANEAAAAKDGAPAAKARKGKGRRKAAQ